MPDQDPRQILYFAIAAVLIFFLWAMLDNNKHENESRAKNISYILFP